MAWCRCGTDEKKHPEDQLSYEHAAHAPRSQESVQQEVNQIVREERLNSSVGGSRFEAPRGPPGADALNWYQDRERSNPATAPVRGQPGYLSEKQRREMELQAYYERDRQKTMRVQDYRVRSEHEKAMIRQD